MPKVKSKKRYTRDLDNIKSMLARIERKIRRSSSTSSSECTAPRALAACYFPQEFQGDFVMQSYSNEGTGVRYSPLNITVDAISIWGNCHRRIGNNFILMFNETNCMTCLHLKLRSPNVIQVLASSPASMSKCSTNEEIAETDCPSEESLFKRQTTETLLFKTRDVQGQAPKKQYCPIDGRYYAKYKGRSPRGMHECVGFNSTVDSCPSGSTLNFRLRSCTFDTYDLKFDCLGHWESNNKGEVYLIFVDNRYLEGRTPRYRCALYKQDCTGKIEMAISRDSTCSTELYNSTHGYETLILAPKAENPWPAEVTSGICTFPKWITGNWEHIRVEDDTTMVYKDHLSFKTYTIKCAGSMENSDKYLIFSRTQCDEESYNCIKLVNRSKNILEFQLGTYASPNKDITLCSDDNFDRNSWITQGRLNSEPNMQSGLCPITGEYVGVIPDAPDLCAKLWSDCRAPELMYYQVSHCQTSEVYEERKYQCLGHWREANVLYTYTRRKDVATGIYECFVGSILGENEISIKEAGEHCQRNSDTLRYGMKLVKTQPLFSCIESPSTTERPMLNAPTRPGNPRFPSTTSKEIDSNDIPKLDKNPNSGVTFKASYFYILLYLFTLYL